MARLNKSHRPVSDPFLGILSLDTDFPRIVGDAGNPDSYPFDARVRIVNGAGAGDIVHDGAPSEELAQRFVQAAQELEGQGACALVSTCGFLISLQDRLAATVDIPVMLSALSFVPILYERLDGKVLGIITADSQKLGPNALAAANISATDVVIGGMQSFASFREAFIAPKGSFFGPLQVSEITSNVIAVAMDLIRSTPEIRAFVLECGNLPPYAKAIATATDRPVYSILDGAAQIMADRLVT